MNGTLMSLLTKREKLQSDLAEVNRQIARELDLPASAVTVTRNGKTTTPPLKTAVQSPTPKKPVDRDKIRRALADGKVHTSEDLAKATGASMSDAGRAARKMSDVKALGGAKFKKA